MFNQASVAPDEGGSISEFVMGTVSVDGRYYEDPKDRFKWTLRERLEKTATKNPVEPTGSSLANGKLAYNTICFVCHGDTRKIDEHGFADTRINGLGMIAPALISLAPRFTDGYIYEKAQYGGATMPALGSAVTDGERWNIILYIRELEKK